MSVERGRRIRRVNCDSPMKVLEEGNCGLWKDDLPTSVKGGKPMLEKGRRRVERD